MKRNQMSGPLKTAAPSLMLLGEHLGNPGVFYSQLPSAGDQPVYWDSTIKCWIVIGFQEAKWVLGHPSVFSVERLPSSERLRSLDMDALIPLNDLLSRQILFSDGAQHKAVQNVLLKPAFHQKKIASLQAFIQTQVNALLSPLLQREEIDLVSDFAGVLPTLVSAHLLGLDERIGNVGKWMEWNTAFEHVLASLQSVLPTHGGQTVNTLLEAAEAFRVLVRSLREERGKGEIDEASLLQAMIASPLDNEDIVANCLVLLAGGYQTLTQLIVRSISWIYKFSGLRDFLLRNPDRLQDVLKETMRLDGSSQFLGRRAVEDTVVAGCPIRAGQGVVVLLGAANRDPRQFPNPDQFDLNRPRREHLGFAHGLHHCWGTALAMLEATVAVRSFLECFPIAVFPTDEAILWSPTANVRCPVSLPVQLTSTRASSETEPLPQLTSHFHTEPLLKTTVSIPDEPLPLRGETGHEGATGTALVQHLFEAYAARTPNAPAVINETGVILNYRQLNERANQLAYALQHKGVGPESVVGVCMQRSPEAVIAFLGILKAGGAYAPLDSDAPERLASMVQDANSRVILVQKALRERLNGLPGTLDILEMEAWMDGADTPTVNPSSSRSGDELSYIIYTSGSTGQPKGVEIVHRGLHNLVVGQSILRVQPAERVLQAASLMYDASIFEFCLALCHGASLCIAPIRAGEGLTEFLRDKGVNVLVLTPTVLLHTPFNDLPALRVVMAAGESCSAEVVRRWSGPSREVWNLYGPTETSVWATAALCHNDGEAPGIGSPIANVEAWILDEQGRPVSSGESGMLYIGGSGLMRGYRNDLHKTATALVPHPFEAGGLLYRTGDLVHLTSDGTLMFERRVDAYLKLHGLRIDAGEVETALVSLPEIEGAGVLVRDEQLVAFVVCKAGERFDVQGINRALQRSLPQYMIPTRLVPIAHLPRKSHSDKIDRDALEVLAIPSAEELPSGGRDLQSADVLEGQLLALFKKVLLQNQQGHRDAERAIAAMSPVSDFFEYGGSSVVGVALYLEIKRLLPSLTIPENAVYLHRTARTFAVYIRSLTRDGQGPEYPPSAQRDERPWIVCHHQQPNAAYRLFIVPEAGAGASQYFSWQQVLKDVGRERDIELCFVQLPGREERSDERPYTDLHRLVEELLRHIVPYLDGKSYGIFGHSLGGILGYELTRALQRSGHQLPASLCLSGSGSPQIPAPTVQWLQQSDEVFLSNLRMLGGIPQWLLDDPSLMKRNLPLLRADFSLIQSYKYAETDPLPISVAVWGGLQDNVVSVNDLLAWKEIQRCSLHFVQGNHFFHQDHLIRQLMLSTQCATLRFQSELRAVRAYLARTSDTPIGSQRWQTHPFVRSR